jgi:hypothetical protein
MRYSIALLLLGAVCACGSQSSPSPVEHTGSVTSHFDQGFGLLSAEIDPSHCLVPLDGSTRYGRLGYKVCDTNDSTEGWNIQPINGPVGTWSSIQRLQPNGTGLWLVDNANCFPVVVGISRRACLGTQFDGDRITFLDSMIGWDNGSSQGPIMVLINAGTDVQVTWYFDSGPENPQSSDNEWTWQLTGFDTAFGLQVNGATQYLSFPAGGDCHSGTTFATLESPSPAVTSGGVLQPTAHNRLLLREDGADGGFLIGTRQCGTYAGNDTWLSANANGSLVWGPSWSVFHFNRTNDGKSLMLYDNFTGLCAASLFGAWGEFDCGGFSTCADGASCVQPIYK